MNAASAERVKQFKKSAIQTVEQISRDKTILEVVELFALHLSTDPKLQQLIAAHWLTPLCIGGNASIESEIAARFMSLLTEPIRLELHVRTENRVNGIVYLFGPEVPVFGIPMDLFRVNYVIYACLVRLIAQGHRTNGRRAFASFVCSANNCESKWSEFGFNKTLQQQWNRAPIVTTIASFFAGTAHRSNTLPTAPSAPQRDYSRMTRVLILAALTDTLSRITGGSTMAAVHGREMSDVRARCTWLDDVCLEELYRVRSLCKTDALFNVKAFLAVLMRQYERIVK